MNCSLCQSGAHLEEHRFEGLGRFWICTRCYNNELLREQIRGKFARLFEEVGKGETGAREKILALARQSKLPEPEIKGS